MLSFSDDDGLAGSTSGAGADLRHPEDLITAADDICDKGNDKNGVNGDGKS